MSTRLSSAILAAILIAGAVSQSASQEKPAVPSEARPDSSKAIPDSLLFHFFLPPSLGSLDNNADTTLFFSRERMQWQDPRELPQLVGTLPGVILRDQVQIGQYTSPTIDGLDWRSIGILWNGRTFSDPASGIYNLELMTQEYLERVEVVTGPRAFLYGLNTTGGAINLETRNYNSNRPFTRLFYSESSYGYAQTDGSFAQNISRHMNLTTGFHFQGTDGRFSNESNGSWQVRGKIRYALTPRISLLLSEYFTSTNTNLNGGVDPSSFSFGTIVQDVVVKNSDSYEKLTRHDVDLTAVGTFFPDSNDVTTLTGYYSNDLREYRDEENRLGSNGVLIRQDHRSSWSGVQLTQTLSTPLGLFLAGATVERRQVEGSPTIGRRSTMLTAAWAKDEILVAQRVNLAVYGRVQRIMDKSTYGIGADARINFAGGLALFGGLSVSHRVPNFTELYWSDSTALGNPDLLNERHAVVEGGLEWSGDAETFARVSVDFRTIAHPVLVEPLDTASIFPPLRFTTGGQIKIADLTLSFSYRVWRLLLEGNGSYFLSRSGGTVAEDLPQLRISGGIYFRDKLFKEELDLKAGFRGWYRTRYNGDLFNPQVLAYVPNSRYPLGRAASVDFVLLFHLGDAQIHFIWENLPGISYYASPGYPGLDRVLRFGLSWDFWN